MLQYDSIGNEALDYKKLMDEDDPIDKLILELAEKGELKVGIVEVKEERWRFLKKYMHKFFSRRVRHTS
ncbi:MAG: hypothetical protein JSW60_07955 [Thermoplasmatales archaeon]|nr:MAG: hypothetical protein JSW60_07955 [Thermoplasmatales archaeon]